MTNPGVKCRDLSQCIRLATAGCDSVVELGCGFGNRLQNIEAAVRIGVDAHGPYIAEAWKRYPKTTNFVVSEAGDYVQYCLDKNVRFDAVLMVDFIEHLDHDAARALLRGCKKIAKRIILYVPLGKHPQTRDTYEMGADHWQTHRSTWEVDDLEMLGFHAKEWRRAPDPNRPDIDPRAAFCIWMSQLSNEYWESAAKRNPFDAVRTGWTEADFDNREDDSICRRLDFKPDDVVLDYGCGPGYACKLVAPKVGHYVGLDYSEAMLGLARVRCVIFPNASFIKGDGVSIPYQNASFDCIFCELVFQHLSRWNTLEILGEMMRVLKPDGRAALQFPTKFYGADIGFTVEELVARLPGWLVEQNSAHYVTACL